MTTMSQQKNDRNVSAKKRLAQYMHA